VLVELFSGSDLVSCGGELSKPGGRDADDTVGARKSRARCVPAVITAPDKGVRAMSE
jgi:hypothetical protein